MKRHLIGTVNEQSLDLHGFFETFFINGHLNRDVGQAHVDFAIRFGTDSRIVFRVLVVLSNGSNTLTHSLSVRIAKGGKARKGHVHHGNRRNNL